VRLLARAAGLVLIVVVLWVVGWQDRVTAAGGEEVFGDVLSRTAEEAVVRTAEGERRVRLAAPDAVHLGLRGAFRSFGDRPRLVLLGVGFHLLALLAAQARWGVLLQGADLKTPAWTVVRLGWIGMFMAAGLPGGLGTGDLVKAFYVARTHRGRKTRAVVTVFVDRAIGLFVLCLIASVAVLFAPAGSRLATVRTVLLAVAAAAAACLLLLLSDRARRTLRLTALLRRLPFPHVWREVEAAALVFGRRRGVLGAAALLSLLGHSLFLTAFYCYGAALGDALPAAAVLVAIPVAQMVSAVPGLPGGWGVGDLAYLAFLPETGVVAAQAVALSFTYRIVQLLLALPAGLWLFRHRGEVDAGAIEDEMHPVF